MILLTFKINLLPNTSGCPVFNLHCPVSSLRKLFIFDLLICISLAAYVDIDNIARNSDGEVKP